MSNPTVFFIDNQELYVFGTYDTNGVFYEGYGAAVAWNLNFIKDTIVVDGMDYIGHRHERKGEPYITLVSIRDPKTHAWLGDDPPLRGGSDSFMAREIGKSLIAAADYLDQLDQGE